MSRFEQIMESGCAEDFRQSLTTEGDMTYSNPDWYSRNGGEDVDEIQAAIELLRANGYAVVLPAEW